MSRTVRTITKLQADVLTYMNGVTAAGCSSSELLVQAADLRATGLIRPASLVLLGGSTIDAVAADAGLGVSLVEVRVALAGGSLEAPVVADLLARLGDHIGLLERRTVTALAADALRTDLGFTIVMQEGEHADGIEARIGDEVMLLAVRDGGEILADQAGTDACAARRDAFPESRRRRGVQTATVAVDEHEQGAGPLIAAAARAGEASLAAGVARHATRSRGWAGSAAPVGRQVRHVGIGIIR